MCAVASTSGFVADASPIAAEALQRIALIYAVEKDIAAVTPTNAAPPAQERSRPVVAELEPWLRAKLPLLSQKSKLAEAIRYAPSRWEVSAASSTTAGSRSIQHSRTFDPPDRPQSQKTPCSPAPTAAAIIGR